MMNQPTQNCAWLPVVAALGFAITIVLPMLGALSLVVIGLASMFGIAAPKGRISPQLGAFALGVAFYFVIAIVVRLGG